MGWLRTIVSRWWRREGRVDVPPVTTLPMLIGTTVYECTPQRIAGMHVICGAVVGGEQVTLCVHEVQCLDRVAFWQAWQRLGGPELYLEDGTRWEPWKA